MEFISIDVSPREGRGSADASRLRNAGFVPANLYGLQRPNISLAIPIADVERFLATGSHLVELRLGEKARPAILREIQYDQVTDQMLHVDFTRVDGDQPVETSIPVHFKGRAKGEGEGGVFQALLQTVSISARPQDLPREFLLDINDMGLGDTLHVSDLPALPGVTFLDAPEELVAQVTTPKIESIEPEGEEEAPAEAAAAEADAEPSAEG